MTRAAGPLTVDDHLSLPADAPRCELVEGVLHVTPAPGRPHQDLVFEIARRLDARARRRKLGRLVEVLSTGTRRLDLTAKRKGCSSPTWTRSRHVTVSSSGAARLALRGWFSPELM